MIDQLTHAGDTAMVKIVADDGKNYDLKVPLNGFTAAHDSMAEQARQKAKPTSRRGARQVAIDHAEKKKPPVARRLFALR